MTRRDLFALLPWHHWRWHPACPAGTIKRRCRKRDVFVEGCRRGRCWCDTGLRGGNAVIPC